MTQSTSGCYRILVVDDQEMIRLLIAEVIEDLGHTAVLAANGKEALNLFQRETFHLVITDLTMPEMNGVRLAAAIKAQTPHVPVLMITGTPEEFVQGVPVNAVMEKPFSLNALREQVNRHLSTP